MELAFTDQEPVQLLQLCPRGELEVVEEVDDLLEAGVASEVLDLVPDVP